MDPAAILPTEIFHQILTLLDAADLAHVTQASTLWNQLGRNGVLWQTRCRSRWNGKRYMRRVYEIGIIALGKLTNNREAIMVRQSRQMAMGVWTSGARISTDLHERIRNHRVVLEIQRTPRQQPQPNSSSRTA
jgi:F-box-like